jgi:hypothetical protein
MHLTKKKWSKRASLTFVLEIENFAWKFGDFEGVLNCDTAVLEINFFTLQKLSRPCVLVINKLEVFLSM